jgi:precorrin-2/cobalt-factor-2 C20-methyltransferase
MTRGTIFGLGLGPGEPDLMSVRADRLLRQARHIAYFRKAGKPGQARQIVAGLLAEDVVEFPMEYPVTTEIPLEDPAYNDALGPFYAECARHLREVTDQGCDVVVLCEGDPFFYGSFMHLYTRLRDTNPVQVVPAITGMSGAWTATGQPITWGDDVLTVLMGTLPTEDMVAHMRAADALAIMKTGRNLPRVRQALAQAGRLDDAWLIERGTMPDQRVLRLSDVDAADCPYFAIVLVHGHGRRPEAGGVE